MTTEVKKEGEEKPEEKKPAEEKKEESVGDIINKDQGKKEDKKDPETVGLDKFLEVKNENKELKQSLADLQKKIDSGVSTEDLADDIKALATEFNIEPKFLGKLTKAIEKSVEKKAEATADARVRPLEEKDRADRIDKIFTKHFTAAMEKMPEYEKIVNPDVIKTLSLDPKNADKTFSQLIEETYGNALGGKKTIEQTKPRGGKEPEEIDFDRARKDSDYFKEIMANPDLKKKYNSGLENRLGAGF